MPAKNRIRVIALITLMVFSFSNTAFALEHLEGQEAKNYVGDVKSRLTQERYVYEVLTRSHRDTMNGRFSDGVIFSKITDRFHYKKRTDGEHIIVVGKPEGRVEDPVTAEPLIWNPLSNTLNDDHPYAHVFLDGEKELAILYLGTKTRLRYKINNDGYLEIDLKIRGQRKRKNRRS